MSFLISADLTTSNAMVKYSFACVKFSVVLVSANAIAKA
jgi:hypothetical protein